MILETERLVKSFGGLTAVQEVNLRVREGELASIIGPNGAGKTTLFNLLTGHLPLDSGRVIFKGQDITGLPPHTISRMGIGRSFQRLNIFPRLSAFENVQVAVFSAQRRSRNLFSRASRLARGETEAILDSVGLRDKKEVKGGLLAHGDQKRLEMGIALAIEPTLIVSGDLHALAAGKILRSGDLDFSDNPVNTVLNGPLGTGDLGFPSAFRDTPPKVPSQLSVEETLKPQEKNAFTILDVTPESIRFRLFAWRPPQPVEQIDALDPILTFELKRK